MTDLSSFIQTIRGFTGIFDIGVHSDALVTSWVRMGEERVSRQLRIADQITISAPLNYTANVAIDVPEDWVQNDFVRVVGGKELQFEQRGAFYSRANTNGYYTSSGRKLIIGGPAGVAGQIELHYFAVVPELDAEDSSWLANDQSQLLVSATLIPAFMRMQEPDQSMAYETYVGSAIVALNEAYQMNTARGGRIVRARSRRLG